MPDARARERIGDDLGATLFVEAGAGSGKTTALVDRVVALVERGGCELREIAAITFTEKAATELRDRLRAELTRRVPEALEQLDGAAIGTLHAFAQRLLGEHPVEAGLPPRIEVLDEVTSGIEFERRWRLCREALFADAVLGPVILLLTATGVRPDALRLLAAAFNDNWDLVETRVAADPGPVPPVARTLGPALDAIDAVCSFAAAARPGDTLADRLREIAAWSASVRSAADDLGMLDATFNAPSFKAGNLGRRANWPDQDPKAISAALAVAAEGVERARGQVAEACVDQIAAAIRRFTLDAADARRRTGRLEFHDLLVLARELVRDDGRVRAHLHRTYRRMLLDEFQDTDPIQIELAIRIAADDPSADGPWPTIEPSPGQLFVVGDPKQSIYRFRRADITVFNQAREHLGPPVHLVVNFRSATPVIAWVNRTFAALMRDTGFVPLEPHRPAPSTGAAVGVLGRTPLDKTTSADQLRAAEAAAVARAVTACVAEGWSVGDDAGGWRPARLGDIAILVPARTSLPFLEDALEAAGIPLRAEASSLVYASRAVRDLLMVLRAVEDPTDQLAVVSALRTPLLGCGDDDLYRHRVEDGGTWHPIDAPGGAGVVADGLAYLGELHGQRMWRSPAELLGRIAEDRRAFEVGAAEGRARDVWRRLRFVIDQARAWTEVTGGSLRQYLAWVAQQTAEGARVAEAVLPETDDDAVRIMTIHAAKGLEFPITVVSGMSTAPQTRRAPVDVVFPPTGGVGYRVGSAVRTDEYEAWRPIDEQMALEERIRLLYVACTRARDHLVVSVHRRVRDLPEMRTWTNAELVASVLADDVPEITETDRLFLAPAPSAPAPPMPFDAWQAERERAMADASRPTTIAATALGHPVDAEDAGLLKAPRDLDLPPWLKGRYGTAVGRAVHGVLQTIDLATGERVGELVAAQCEAEAIPEEQATVRRLVGDALAAPSVRAAAARPHWRELYACTPLADGRLLEGYVDLLYRSAEGLVVVDYKTAATADAAELDRRADIYRLQGGSYAVAVGAAAGEPVVRVTFLFLTPEGPVERHLDEWAAVSELVGAPGS